MEHWICVLVVIALSGLNVCSNIFYKSVNKFNTEM